MDSILVGYGSIGKRHFELLSIYSDRIAIIDPIINTLNLDSTKHTIYANLADFLELEYYKNKNFGADTLVVLANWGPDHFEYYKKFKNLGFKKFLIEKPIVSKLKDLINIKYDLENLNTMVWSNFHLRFDTGIGRLIRYVTENNFGRLELFSIIGGAKCLSTTGIHWLDLFCYLNDSPVKEAFIDAVNDLTNPRSDELVYLSGELYLRCENSSKFVACFTNNSYSDATVQILWANHKCEISGRKIKVYENQCDSKLPKNRTNEFNKIIFEDSITGDGMNEIYKLVMSVNDSMPKVLTANEIILDSLAKSKFTKMSIRSYKRKSLAYDWRIS